jgi:hypothetical protein
MMMTESKSRRVKVANLPESKALCTITNKPVALIVFVWLVFTIVLFTAKEKILCIPFGIYGLIMTFKEEKKIFTGHIDYLVIYDEDKKEECDIYYLSEIRRWYFKQKLFNPSVTLFLQEGETFLFCKCVGSEIYSYLRKVMPEKEVQPKRQ